MPSEIYQKLTRNRTAWQTAVTIPRVSLWLGSDHLLYVEQLGFEEKYKRFYFRDIQAITIVPSSRRTIWNAIFIVPLAIVLAGLVICLTQPDILPGVIVFSIFAAVFLIPTVINNVLGPACVCQLRTAVQTEWMASLSRVKRTRKVLDRIRPLIAAAQGQLTPEEIAVQMQAAAGTEAAAPPVISPGAPQAMS